MRWLQPCAGPNDDINQFPAIECPIRRAVYIALLMGRLMGMKDFQRSPHHIVIAVTYTAAYVAFALMARPHASGALMGFPWHAGSALSLALMARFGIGWFPLALMVTAASAMLHANADASGIATAWSALAEVAGCGLAAIVMRRPHATLNALTRVRAVVRFFFAVAVAASVAAVATVMFHLLSGAGDIPLAAWPASQMFLRIGAALLLVAPLLLSMGGKGPALPSQSQLAIETALQAIALAVISWEVFGRFVNEEIHFFYLLFLPFGWITVRHGLPGAALALAIVYSAPLVSDWFVPHKDQAIIELQIRLIVLGITMLLLGAVVSERRQTQARMLARQAELAHVQRLNVGWEMASALAHEINQPLTAAMNYTQASLRMMSTASPDLERTGAIMRKSLDQIERVGQIVHGLRDFMNKGELRLSQTEIVDTVEDALRLVSPEANAAGIALHSSDLGTLPVVMADKTQLVQILVNLMRNSIQALSASRTANGWVSVRGKVVDRKIDICVSDNGPGIDPEIDARLFEPFVTTKESGMGLGLSISRSIAEAHNGRLTVESPSTGGTAFHIVLPIAEKRLLDA